MSRLRLLIVLMAVSHSAQSGEVSHSSVEYEDGVYSVSIAVVINVEQSGVYDIVTDYAALAQLSDMVIESAVIENPLTTSPQRHLLLRPCILFFCVRARVVEDLYEINPTTIRTVFVPELSDFSYGVTEWHINRIDDQHTEVTFNSRFKPTFWVPPFIGPLLVKRRFLSAATGTVIRIETLASDDTFRAPVD